MEPFQNRCAEMVIIEVLRSVGSRKKGEPMALIRLELHEHPALPQHEMRQKSVLDSGGTVVGTVANLSTSMRAVGSFASWTSLRATSWVWKASTIWCPWKP